MQNELVTQNIWQQITATTKKCKQRCYVAVAYMGTGGADMLPLKAGSKLVVDASNGAVSSGQTNPTELLKLHDNQVDIYSYPELHAKVFVLGTRLFIGSTNVSRRSQERLQEAAFHTSDKKLVAEARDFVKCLCIAQLKLDETELKELCLIYKPPRIPQAKGVTKQDSVRGWIICTEPRYIPDYAESAIDTGKQKLKESHYSDSDYKHDYIYWPGRLALRERDVFFRVNHIGHRKELFSESVVLFVERIEGKNEYIIFYSTNGIRPKSFQKLSSSEKKILNVAKDVKRINKTELNTLRQIT